MLSVTRLAIVGWSIAGILCIVPPGQIRAADALSPSIKTQILNLLASRDLNTDRCIPTTKMSDLVGLHPELAQQIVEFTSANLASRRDLLGKDCTCPTELAFATVRAAPDLAGSLRRVIGGRYPDCDSAVETAMAQSLSGIAPGAGNAQQSSANGASPSQTSGLTGGSPARIGAAAADLSPDLQAEILEALESDPQRENQCISANAFGALVKAHPELALAIMEFADLKLSSKGRLLGDECVCPIELATATVTAVPELTAPVRRALDDRYPECTQPAAAGRNGSRKLPLEPPCPQTASPSC